MKNFILLPAFLAVLGCTALPNQDEASNNNADTLPVNTKSLAAQEDEYLHDRI